MSEEAEEHNLEEIYRLNQRGGRTLSVTDLMEAGTLDPDTASLCWIAVEQGESFLAGAVPGGAGKTTLMGSLLAFLPPGEEIVTTATPEITERAAAGKYRAPICLLAHEIGSGPWHAYIWGDDAQRFFRAARRDGYRCVSCLHADNPPQVRDTAESCDVSEEDLQQIGMQIFMWLGGSRMSPTRRVSSLHLRLDGELQKVVDYDTAADEHNMVMDGPELWQALADRYGMQAEALEESWDRRRRWLRELQREGVCDFARVRGAILECEVT